MQRKQETLVKATLSETIKALKVNDETIVNEVTLDAGNYSLNEINRLIAATRKLDPRPELKLDLRECKKLSLRDKRELIKSLKSNTHITDIQLNLKHLPELIAEFEQNKLFFYTLKNNLIRYYPAFGKLIKVFSFELERTGIKKSQMPQSYRCGFHQTVQHQILPKDYIRSTEREYKKLLSQIQYLSQEQPIPEHVHESLESMIDLTMQIMMIPGKFAQEDTRLSASPKR